MQTIKRSALSINICFSLVIAIGALVFLGTYTASHASPMNCTAIFYNSMYREPTQYQKTQCERKWAYLTRWEIKRMNDFTLKQK